MKRRNIAILLFLAGFACGDLFGPLSAVGASSPQQSAISVLRQGVSEITKTRRVLERIERKIP